MKDIPENYKFLSSHEWAKLEEDGKVTVGISDYAQDQLGDIVFVELPEIDSEVKGMRLLLLNLLKQLQRSTPL